MIWLFEDTFLKKTIGRSQLVLERVNLGLSMDALWLPASHVTSLAHDPAMMSSLHKALTKSELRLTSCP